MNPPLGHDLPHPRLFIDEEERLMLLVGWTDDGPVYEEAPRNREDE